MKQLFALIGLLGFTASAHALVDENASYPVAVCHNEVTVASVYTMPNQKEAQLIVHSAQNASVAAVSMIVVPLVTPDAQLFMNSTTTLRLVSVGDEIKGVLNMQRNQPGISQILNCKTFVHIQPVQPAMM